MYAVMPKPQAHRHDGALKLHRRETFGEVSIAPHPPKTPAIAPIRSKKAKRALDCPIIGGPDLSACNTGKGGARNRADRESHALKPAQIANLRAAERHAEKIGLPLTRMITIHWEAAGVTLEGMANATGKFLDLLTKTLDRHGSATAWVRVHEGGDGKGGHCHLLVHVPAELVPIVTRLQIRWLRSITGNAYRARVIHSDPIGGRLGLEKGNPDLHRANLDAALAYVLKGANEEAASQFGLERVEPGGRVIGKRCGTSQNIGAKARREWMDDD